MPSSVIGALRVSLGLDSAQFESGAAKAEKRAGQLGDRLSSALKAPISTATVLKGTIAGLAGALALDQLAGATQRALDYADAIADLSDRTGASTKIIQEFRYAAQLSGSSVEAADGALEKFARTQGLAQAGGDAQVKLFRELGVTSTDFDTALRQTMDGLAKLPTVQQRNAVALQLFGKQAASLTSLLGQGSAGFSELANRANELGIVLRDDVIRNAGSANDQLDTMKMIVNAQFANVVAQNASSLTAMAQGITDVTSAIIKFLASNPQTALSIMGGLAGSRGGPIGAALGAAGGFIAGDKLAQVSADNNNDLAFRRKQFRAAIANRRATQAAKSSGGLFSIRQAQGEGSAQSGTAAEVVRQGKLYLAAIRAKQNAPKTSGVKVPLVGDAEAKAAASKAAADAKRLAAEQKREAAHALEVQRRFEHELAQSRNDELESQLDLTADQTERVNIQQQLLANDRDAALEQIATNKDLSAAQKKQLSDSAEIVFANKNRLLHIQDQEELARQELDKAEAQGRDAQDILQAQADLARTAKERGAIEQQILDVQFALLKQAKQVEIDNAVRRGDQDAANLARGQLSNLGTLQGLAKAKVARQNQGPLASYLDSIPRTADEMNEALEKVQADGLESLIDGISKTKGSFKDLASVVSSVADDIISSLLKIGLQKGVAVLFGSILGGGNGVGSYASPFASTGSSFVPDSSGLNLSGYRAAGGPVIGGKNYVVGERGPELFTAPHSGTIIANDNIGTGGGGVNVTQHITIPGGVDLMTRTEGYRVAGAVKDATMAAIIDRDRRRG